LLTLPIPVARSLRKLGHDIKDARRRRRLPMSIVTQRASISEPTLIRIEKGDPKVAIGSYATVLFVLGMVDRLADLVDPKNDPVGLQLEEENLPKRIRGADKRKPPKEK
jgi:DNA-binding XRE family transcriptional regulator